MDEWRWYGNAGHFICSSDCRFHLTTEVGRFLVSTVGQYLPDSAVREITSKSRGVFLEGRGDAREADYMKKLGFEEIGLGRTFETMVFKLGTTRCTRPDCDCGLPDVADWGGVVQEGYNDAGSATRGHMKLCAKYAKKGARK